MWTVGLGSGHVSLTPLKIFFGDGKRDRTEMSRGFRIHKNRIRERKRRALGSSAVSDANQGDDSDAAAPE